MTTSEPQAIAHPTSITSLRPRHGGRNVGDRLDGFEQELNQLAEGIGEIAEAIDLANATIVDRIDALGTQLDRIEAAVQGQALVLGQAVPPLVDVTKLVGEAQQLGWRKAWRARRRRSA